MSNDRTLTRERLREVLVYDPDSGVFTCRIRRAQMPVGSIAGTKCDNGYLKIAFGNDRYYSHRLAWLYVHGEWPAAQVDHINLDRSDNRIANLRLATPAENLQNGTRAYKNTTSGFRGVVFNRQRRRWSAQIQKDNKVIHLGLFDTPEQAYLSAKSSHHPFWAKALTQTTNEGG